MIHSNIHPSAIIEPGAKLGKNVTVEAYAIIKSGVTLHDDVVIKAHVYLDGNTTIGSGTCIYPFASIGTKTQDLKFKGEKTFVEIGKGCEIREFVTINSSSGENTTVKVGDNCLIMAYCHIAHNCEIGNRVVMSNNATLAGHVIVEDNAIIGGLTAVHQFVRIGTYAMVGGMSRVTHDIPPYTIGAGIPFKYGGLNMVGLKRRVDLFPIEVRRALTNAFNLTLRMQLPMNEALNRIEQEVEPCSQVKHWVHFCKETKRGLMGMQGVKTAGEEELLLVDED